MIVIQFLIIFLITGIKGIFSAADTAFTYLNRAEITQLSKKDKKAKKIKILMDDTNKFFGIIEVGINMSELIASAYTSETIVNQFAFVLEKLPLPRNLSLFIAIAFMTVFLAYILLVFGGVIPKKIARNNPKKTAYQLADVLWVVAKLNYPFERLIDVSNRFFSKLFGLKEEKEEKMTEKQLKMIIREAREEGVLANIEKRIMFNALKANDLTVNRIMIPIEKADFINITDDLEKILANVKRYKYTRMPVYENNPQNVIGIFNIKDLIFEYDKNQIETKSLTSLLRKAIYVEKQEKIFSIFQTLQKEKQVMAIVVEGQKQAIGVVTIEDIVEELVGKIFDEYDEGVEKSGYTRRKAT